MAHQSKNEKGVHTWYSRKLEKMFAKIGLVLVGYPVGDSVGDSVGDPVWERLKNGLGVSKLFLNRSRTV